jgi:hypothetical protein
MTPAEIRFKNAIRSLIFKGVHPTMTPINLEVVKHGATRHRQMNTLNGQECRWLRRDMQIPPIRGREKAPCPWHCCAGNGRVPSYAQDNA